MLSYIHALGSALYTLTFCHITCFGQLGCSNVDSSKGFEKNPLMFSVIIMRTSLLVDETHVVNPTMVYHDS